MRAMIPFSAVALALAAPAVAQQSFTLECEVEEVADEAFGTYQPMRSVRWQITKFSIDPVARSVLIEGKDGEGNPANVLRKIEMITSDVVLICQADECQKFITKGTTNTKVDLTKIDLKTGQLSRYAEVFDGAEGTANFWRLKGTRTGECRRL